MITQHGKPTFAKVSPFCLIVVTQPCGHNSYWPHNLEARFCYLEKLIVYRFLRVENDFSLLFSAFVLRLGFVSLCDYFSHFAFLHFRLVLSF
jgi:hypothetical protein